MNVVWVILFLCGNPNYSLKSYVIYTSSENAKYYLDNTEFETNYEDGCTVTMYEVKLGKNNVVMPRTKIKTRLTK